ncbi:hypothetical protein OSB04_016732 [Centaurea solstitialis]|uniref:ADP-ribosyl cyclase/cyclic ADP-ribose hydrolase n=1 Tax=Centaurea solstitialis TaxID=347529 RepID=A0AA38TJP1_9ASTR|nr:hypothetical protein OSB04_016732 [Centaurea solstitialis]
MKTQLPSYSYEIFVSFGGDTRNTFTDHLCKALCNAGFRIFRDKDEIKIGHQIKPQLERAIELSTMSIIVFTKSYGESEWCLNELLKILERKKFDDHYIVFPIFYRVQPKTIGKQEGSYWKAFEVCEKSDEHSNEKIDQWRKALKEASKIAGRVLPDESNE